MLPKIIGTTVLFNAILLPFSFHKIIIFATFNKHFTVFSSPQNDEICWLPVRQQLDNGSTLVTVHWNCEIWFSRRWRYINSIWLHDPYLDSKLIGV